MPVVDDDTVTASGEYEKNSDLIKEDLIRLRTWLETQKHLPAVNDEMLAIFHHSCYYNLARTQSCIEAYYTMRTHTPELFGNRDITSPQLVKALLGLKMAVLPVPDPRGYRIIYCSLRDPDPAKCIPTDELKIVLMVLDSCLHRFGIMPGVVVVYNMEGVRLAHLAKCSLSIMRKVTIYNQDANPLRLKEIHVINTVSWIDKLLTLLKPFMKKELLNLITFHGSDIESLYERIPKECLPKDIGGTQQSVDVLDAENTENLESLRDFFAKDEMIRVDESKREKKKSKKKHDVSEIMFERLEID